MKKNIGAFGTGQFSLGTLVGGRPGTTIFQNPGEAGGGGGTTISHVGYKFIQLRKWWRLYKGWSLRRPSEYVMVG